MLVTLFLTFAFFYQESPGFFGLPISKQMFWVVIALAIFLAWSHYRHTRRLEVSRIAIEDELVKTKLSLEQMEAQLLEAREKIQSLILSDPLTGLRNRRFITEYLEKDIAHVLRTYSRPQEGGHKKGDIYFLLVAIDQLKSINTTYGNAAGDFVLKSVASLLKSCIRQSDIPVRWSGGEFLLVCRHCERSCAKAIAARICQKLAEATFHWHRQTQLRLTCSIGYAPFPMLPSFPDLIHWDDVIALGKQALDMASESGGNIFYGVTSASQNATPFQPKPPPLNPKSLALNFYQIEQPDIRPTQLPGQGSHP